MFFQARKGPGGKVEDLPLCALPVLYRRQARVLVGLHIRQKVPQPRHAALPRHVAGRQRGGRAQVYCPWQAGPLHVHHLRALRQLPGGGPHGGHQAGRAGGQGGAQGASSVGV